LWWHQVATLVSMRMMANVMCRNIALLALI
jgi:hypothetical protein